MPGLIQQELLDTYTQSAEYNGNNSGLRRAKKARGQTNGHIALDDVGKGTV